MDLINFTFT